MDKLFFSFLNFSLDELASRRSIFIKTQCTDYIIGVKSHRIREKKKPEYIAVVILGNCFL